MYSRPDDVSVVRRPQLTVVKRAEMAVWCLGSKSFIDSIPADVPISPLTNMSKPAPGERLIIDLDDQKLNDAIKLVRSWADAGNTVIVACGTNSIDQAAEAVAQGAKHIALKPFKVEELQKWMEDRPEEDEPADDEVTRWWKRYASSIIGKSPSLYEAISVAQRAAETDCPVLITGESGTGKELLARAFHDASPRADAAFIPVNCPAIPKELVESELFGHAKGAFTGATVSRVGRFAAADGGTLFMDEIGEMDHGVQSKLLRILQDYQVTRVGDSRSQQVDVRVIAATNCNLEEMATKGSFREDLYYRLNVIQIHLPPLRERREDILLLMNSFLDYIAEKRNLPVPAISSEAQDALMAYHWPGNIRQLRNLIERLVILQRGAEVDMGHLPLTVVQNVQAADQESLFFGAPTLPKDGINLRGVLQQFEESMIKQALQATGGNKNQAAKILGLNRTTLVEKLRKRKAKPS